MNENEKINEAIFFYNQMMSKREHYKELKYFFSAFLNASRSVLQYAYKEAKSKKMLNWYSGCVCTKRTVGFFKNLRDTNIHIELAKPKGEVRVPATIEGGAALIIEAIIVSDGKGRVAERLNGNRKKSRAVGSESAQQKLEVKHVFSLNTARGEEDLFDLCGEYLEDIKKVVEEGRKAGAISC